MKSFISFFTAVNLLIVSTTTCIAAELTTDSIEGKWMFTHILMDGTREMKVNRLMEFLTDGSIVNYDAVGNKKSHASFEISDDNIIYVDSKGKQKWKVISFEENVLHVDHRGAEMFFERQ